MLASDNNIIKQVINGFWINGLVKYILIIAMSRYYQYISLGYDCSPAQALRELGLRQYALPFDWIVSYIDHIEACIWDDFSKFHTNVFINQTQTRIIDAYGFEYPHDYPLYERINVSPTVKSTNLSNLALVCPTGRTDSRIEVNPSFIEDSFIGEGVIKEQPNMQIVSNWNTYYPIVQYKYERRISRFTQILRSPYPIIVFTRHSVESVKRLKRLLLECYGNSNTLFINTTPEHCEPMYENNIYHCNTESHGVWNDLTIWKSCLVRAFMDKGMEIPKQLHH